MDVAIVGAGPIGCYLGQQLRGLDVKIFEEHTEIGKPISCTGLISSNVDEILEVPKKSVLNKVKGAKLFSPGNAMVELSRGEDQAYVVDRSVFDREIAKGADIELGHRVSSLDFNAEYIVGADGPNSFVARAAGFPAIEESITGLQYEIPNDSYATDFVELYFGNRIAPEFFAWIVPAKDRLRVGLATNESPKQHLDKFVEEKFGKPEIIETHAGLIPVKCRSRITNENVALVGDAAGQVKPTTGGGIYIGMQSARILAEAIKRESLDYYMREFNEQVLPELVMGSRIRRLIKSLSDSEIDKIWNIMNRPKVKKLFQEHGDMDKPSLLAKGVIKDPGVLLLLPHLRHLWI